MESFFPLWSFFVCCQNKVLFKWHFPNIFTCLFLTLIIFRFEFQIFLSFLSSVRSFFECFSCFPNFVETFQIWACWYSTLLKFSEVDFLLESCRYILDQFYLILFWTSFSNRILFPSWILFYGESVLYFQNNVLFKWNVRQLDFFSNVNFAFQIFYNLFKFDRANVLHFWNF